MSDEQQAGPVEVKAGEVKPKRGREERYGPDGRRIPGKRPTGNPELYKLSGNWRKSQAKQTEAGAAIVQGTGPALNTTPGGELVPNPTMRNEIADSGTASQFLARQGVSLARLLEHAPDAVEYLGKVVRGRVKVPAGLRLQACFKVLDAGGINAQVGERIEAALKQPGGASLQSLAAKLIEAANLAKSRAETGQTSGKPSAD